MDNLRLDNLCSDVLEEILDYITQPACLASICRTSKYLSQIVAPRLYAHVTVNITSFGRFSNLQSWIGTGAGFKITKFTHSLTVIDSPPPQEAITVRRLEFEPDDRIDPRYRWDTSPASSERDMIILMVLVLIPNHKLRSFRFLSDRPLGARVIDYLVYCQFELRHFQAMVRHDSNYFNVEGALSIQDIPKCIQTLETLDIQFDNTDRFHEFVKGLVGGRTPNIRNLRIGVSIDSPFANIFKGTVAKRFAGQNARLTKLKKLSLYGFNLQGLYSTIARILPVQSLTHLALWHCSNTNGFLQEMANRFFSINRLINLQHLVVLFDRPSTPEVDPSLKDLFRICSLRSLHISWHHTRNAHPKNTLAFMPQIGPHLRSLSFHSELIVQQDAAELNYMDQCFGVALSSCSRLQQFAFQVSRSFLDPSIWDDPTFQEQNFWDGLKYLPSLTVLHLRQYPRFQTRASEEHMSWTLERFASGLFRFLDRKQYCREFRAVVIGMWQKGPPYRFGGIPPRHCFVKSTQQLECRPSLSVAIPVTTEELREMGPVPNIVDFDPGCEWLGGLVGQFDEPRLGHRRI